MFKEKHVQNIRSKCLIVLTLVFLANLGLLKQWIHCTSLIWYHLVSGWLVQWRTTPRNTRTVNTSNTANITYFYMTAIGRRLEPARINHSKEKMKHFSSSSLEESNRSQIQAVFTRKRHTKVELPSLAWDCWLLVWCHRSPPGHPAACACNRQKGSRLLLDSKFR